MTSLIPRPARKFPNIPEGDVRSQLNDRLLLLQEVRNKAKPLQDVLTDPAKGVHCPGLKEDEVIYLSDKLAYLYTFYVVIQEKYTCARGNQDGVRGYSFICCADEAIKQCNKLGLLRITSFKSLFRWQAQFRNDNKFEHPRARWKAYEPHVFAAYPEVIGTVKKDLDRKSSTQMLQLIVSVTSW